MTGTADNSMTNADTTAPLLLLLFTWSTLVSTEDNYTIRTSDDRSVGT